MTESQIVIVVSILAFLAVVALIEGLYMLWRMIAEGTDPKISRRLRRLSAGGSHGRSALLSLQKKQLSSNPVLNRLYNAIPRLRALDILLERAAIDMSVTRFLLLQIVLAVVLALVGGLTLQMPWPLAIPIAVIAGFGLPVLFAGRRAHARMHKLVVQLPDMMDFVARALRAGNSFSAALKEGSNELTAPVSTELGIVFDEMNYGLELEDALYNLVDRTGSEDVGFFVAAVMIQKTTGGNLADLLNRLAAIMRDRARTRGEIEINAGEMRLTARILMGLPFVAAAGMFIIQPDYMRLLVEHPVGQMVVAAQIFLMVMGYLVVRKMINFRV